MSEYKNNKKYIVKAFTLAETLIVLVVLGIIAAITIPGLINRQVEKANKTKIKKAMTVYEKALNNIIIMNDFKTNQSIKDFGDQGGNCANTTLYFKKIEGDGCRFKTAESVWWDISNIENPIISLKDEITIENSEEMKEKAKNLSDVIAFAFVGRVDDNTGVLRCNDNVYENSQKNNDDNQKYMKKLWSFIGGIELAGLDQCRTDKKSVCKINDNGEEVLYSKIKIDEDLNVKLNGCYYNRETNTRDCSSKYSNALTGDYYITTYDAPTVEEAKSESICKTSTLGKENCMNNGDYYEAARRKCESQGARLANISELKYIHENNLATFINPYSYWALEEQRWNDAYSYWVNASNGIELNYDDGKSAGSWFKYICIGNT